MSVLEFGRVGKPHGLSGELKIAAFWSESRALLDVPRVLLRFPSGEEREFQVLRARPANKLTLLTLEGVADRTAAEALKGAIVVVEREFLPPLAAGEYYLADLIGASVVGPSGELGRVVRVVTHPTVDSIVIRLSDGREVEQPLLEPWLVGVNSEAKTVELSSTEGFVE